MCYFALNWGQFCSKCSRFLSSIWVWKLLIKVYSHISQGPMSLTNYVKQKSYTFWVLCHSQVCFLTKITSYSCSSVLRATRDCLESVSVPQCHFLHTILQSMMSSIWKYFSSCRLGLTVHWLPRDLPWTWHTITHEDSGAAPHTGRLNIGCTQCWPSLSTGCPGTYPGHGTPSHMRTVVLHYIQVGSI